MGVYTNILKDGSVLAGKVVLVRMHEAENSEEAKPEIIKPEHCKAKGIPEIITQYFPEKAPQVLKVTPLVHSIEELGAWLDASRKLNKTRQKRVVLPR
ncbi:MAG: hypothetical protein EAZ95_06395 [Bacteroidetes bacterium]|nr:MAG: hypothetical protein EAZ95_06395 [Bacteroidota bacterium]